MRDKDFFDGFDESRYQAEAAQRWGETAAFKESTRRWAGFSTMQKKNIKEAMGEITRRMVGQETSKPEDGDVQAAVEEFFNFLNEKFYPCDIEFLRNLADMWVEDPRFAVNYERVRMGGAQFVRDAVHLYCDRHG